MKNILSTIMFSYKEKERTKTWKKEVFFLEENLLLLARKRGNYFFFVFKKKKTLCGTLGKSVMLFS